MPVAANYPAPTVYGKTGYHEFADKLRGFIQTTILDSSTSVDIDPSNAAKLDAAGVTGNFVLFIGDVEQIFISSRSMGSVTCTFASGGRQFGNPATPKQDHIAFVTKFELVAGATQMARVVAEQKAHILDMVNFLRTDVPVSVVDSYFSIADQSDTTKKLAFNVTGTTGIVGTLRTSFTTAKTVDVPDIAGTLLTDAGAQSVTGSKTFTADQIFQGNLTVGPTKRIVMRSNDGTTTQGNISGIHIYVDAATDRPWMSWYDGTNSDRKVVGLGSVKTNYVNSLSLTRFELKTWDGTNGSEQLSTRLSIGWGTDLVPMQLNQLTVIKQVNVGEGNAGIFQFLDLSTDGVHEYLKGQIKSIRSVDLVNNPTSDFDGDHNTILLLDPLNQKLSGTPVSQSIIRFLRETVTTGANTVEIYPGDGTGTRTWWVRASTGNMSWRSGTAFDGTLKHTNTGAHIWFCPDLDGTFAVTANHLGVFAATTSAQLLSVMSDETGTGSLVFATSPTLVTPVLGVALATSVNGLTITSTTGTFTLTAAKTLSVGNTLIFTGTDGSSVAFGAGGTATYTSNNLSVFASTTSAQLAGIISDETGSGALVFANTPTLVTPALGAATATSINGLAITTTTGTFTLTSAKTFAVQNTITLAGTDGNTYTFPSISGTVAILGLAQTYTATQTVPNFNSTGTATFSGSLIVAKASPSINFNDNASTNQGIARILLAQSGTGLRLDIDARNDGASAQTTEASIGFFRNVNTNSVRTFTIFKGDNTGTITFQVDAATGKPSFDAGVGFIGTLSHNNTAARTWTYPNVSGNVNILEAAQTSTALKTFTAGVTITTAALTITDVNVVLSATTGTQFGTATTQKVAFLGSTPIVQEANSVSLEQVLSDFGFRASGATAPIAVGAATVTTINKVTVTQPATAATLTIANNKTAAFNNTLTFAGTDGTTMTFPGASDTLAGLGATNVFTASGTFNGFLSVNPIASRTGGAGLAGIGVIINAGTTNFSTAQTGNVGYTFIGIPTITGTASQVIPIAASLYVNGPPAPGANTTITTALSIYVPAGAVRFDGGIVSTTIDCSTATAASIVKLNQTTATPSNPTGTSGATAKMSGLAVAFTPRSSGRVVVLITMKATSDSTVGDICTAQLYHGTGTAPTNGAALTGTADGTAVSGWAAVSHPFSMALSCILTGLTVGTAYWFDTSQAGAAGSVGTLSNIVYNIIEI